MEYNEFLLYKAGALLIAAFIYNFYVGWRDG